MRSLLVSIALLVFGTNVQGVIVPILGHERGAGMVAIGLYSSSWSAGFVLACAAIGPILGRLGHPRTFLVFALLSAACPVLIWLVPHDAAWITIRFASGFGFGGASTVVESWMLGRSTRGAGFASYMVASLIASLAGTLSLDLVDPVGPLPFVSATLALGLAVLPAALLRPEPPPKPEPFRPRLGLLLRAAPAAALGCLGAGIATGALGGLGPVFGMMLGLDMRSDTLMLAAVSIGGALAYAALGLLPARLDRGRILAAFALAGTAIAAILVLRQGAFAPGALIALVGAFGFAQNPLYGLCVGIACDRSGDRPVASVASEALLLFGAGTMVGPLLAGQVMRVRPDGLFVLLGAVCASVGLASLAGRAASPVGAARAPTGGT